MSCNHDTPGDRMKAHQRIIREREAVTDSGGLFGRWWESIDRSIHKATVRGISTETASKIILQYEWLGTMPAVVLHCYGIFFDGACGGVVVYSPEYTESLGVWDKYGYSGKIIMISRGACVHWAHEHSASKLIMGSMRLLPEKYKVVTATVDKTAGEVGTIYQSCNFHYVGVMSPETEGRRVTMKIGNKNLSERQIGRISGTQGVKSLSMMGISVEKVPNKGRYFYFRGSRKERKENLQAISHLIKPYPKRGGGDGN